jgi:hypothetical protein
LANDKITCKYLSQDNQCLAVSENGEAKEVRKLSCENDQELNCCYICSYQSDCDISCNYLGNRKTSPQEKTAKEAKIANLIIRCDSCHLKMKSARIKLRIGGWGGLWQLVPGGELGELGEELLPVTVYVCPECGNMRFKAEKKTKEKLLLLSE